MQGRSFAAMLEEAIRRYQNRAVEAAQVIEELVELAREMREASARGKKLGLTEDELAFYDALETNDSAVKVLGNETLRTIAQELVEAVRNNVAIDWAVRGERARQDEERGEESPQEARVPAGQTGASDSNSVGAGRTAVGGVGSCLAAATR